MTLTKLLIAGAAIFTLAACEMPTHDAMANSGDHAPMADGDTMMDDGAAMMDDGSSTMSN